MALTLEKAQRNIKALRENNFNATKTLIENGYSKETATKASKRILNSSIRKVAKEQVKTLATTDNPLQALLGIIRMSEGELTDEYAKIIKQDKDLSTKLKAMTPLLNKLGFKWDENQTKVNVPILNITTEQVVPENSTDKMIDLDVK